jgi:hypothetical protein
MRASAVISNRWVTDVAQGPWQRRIVTDLLPDMAGLDRVWRAARTSVETATPDG